MDATSYNGAPKRSVAHIRIIKRESTDLISSLRKMLEGLGHDVNRHGRADTLILACMGSGIVTKSEIIGMAIRLGFHRGHIAIRLKEGAGNNAAVYLWRRDADGRYSVNDRS
ncbi:MAG: hypothetical protein QHC67_16250 [Sphingobium sp.]|uniref:hypothetical protein n=1 Tax=Sphingobium sp. TaxID=1912891 RepID=UPI0029A6D81E|nr:hypothetical protein [Sphingobium sp.]MDX3911348.1 hypothetical protein [Sphingobium sp.]